MKQSYKLQHGLEDPKQATMNLALSLQIKVRLGVSKKVLKVLVAQEASKIFALPLYKARVKILRCCNFEAP